MLIRIWGRHLSAVVTLLALFFPPLALSDSLVVPANSLSGTFKVSWSATGEIVTLYEAENSGSWRSIGTRGSGELSVSKNSGTYYYKLTSCYNDRYTGRRVCSEVAVKSIVVAIAPSTPSGITVPANSSTGTYLASWPSSTGEVVEYQLNESLNGGATWQGLYSGVGRSHQIQRNVDGDYSYRLRACNKISAITSCSAWSAPVSVKVTLSMGSTSGVNLTYKYDALGRLTISKADGVVQSDYSYDPAGNRQSVTKDGSSESGDFRKAAPPPPPTNLSVHSAGSPQGAYYTAYWAPVTDRFYAVTHYVVKWQDGSQTSVSHQNRASAGSLSRPASVKTCNEFLCGSAANF